MPTKQSLIPILLAVTLLVDSFKHQNDNIRIITDSAGLITAVHLSSQETEHAGIIHGSTITQTLDRRIPCSGYLVVAPESTIGIPAPSSGRIISVFYTTGQYVKAGSKIAGLENSDFITMQQEYLDAANQFDYLHEEYSRQGELTVENATSVKKMQVARRDYQSAELRLHALKSQLEILGICPDSVRFDKMTSVIPIKAPGKGTISNIMVHPGSFVEKGKTLFEVVNTKHLLAKLDVPEQYVRFIQKGQLIDFWMIYDTLSTFKAQLISIAHEINRDSHTAIVFAELTETKSYFIPGMSINAKIKANNDTAIFINSYSITHFPSGDCLFVKKNGNYMKIPVTRGITIGDMTEIIGFPAELADSVVLKGVDYLSPLFGSQ